jgi:catechol 2,3-dioxygenase-like lactoylglutathione lyase family enzyme
MKKYTLSVLQIYLFVCYFILPLPLSGAPPFIEQIISIGLTVSEMEKSVDFYSSVLSFEKISDQELSGHAYAQLWSIPGLRLRLVHMRLGEEVIELIQFLHPTGRSIPKDSKSNDRWFQHLAIIVSDMEKASQWLKQHQIEFISQGPQRLPDWNKNAGGIQALYFKDPDDHVLEILHFPPDKGNRKWHQTTQKLFLGIDHTAIVVRNTQTSLAFYRDVLGLKIAGQSENYGIEQERLNQIADARLLITSLKAQKGPGIELLHYLTPTTGRAMPFDTQSNDLWHWQILMETPYLNRLAQELKRLDYLFISAGVIPFSNHHITSHKACMIADPDGHAILLRQKIEGRCPPLTLRDLKVE